MTEINFFINRKLQVTKRESGNKELFEKRQQFTSCENSPDVRTYAGTRAYSTPARCLHRPEVLESS